MKYLFLLCTLCASMLLPGLSEAEDIAAVVKQTSGESVLIRGGKASAATENMAVLPGDTIRTGKDSAVALSFSDGTRVTIGEKSEFSVDGYVFRPNEEQFSFDVLLKKGTSVYSSGKIGKVSPQSVRIRTPQSVIGVRGTKLCISVD